jgi:ATP-dependent RNA helicase RhlE
LTQNRRQRALDGFKSGQVQILVATDIAARGIDVNNISHIINYDIPATSETYIHRIGRTARAQKSGEAYTFVTGEDKAIVRDIEKSLGKPLDRRIVDDFDYQNRMPVLPATNQGTGAPPANGSRPKAAGKPRRRQYKGFGRR